jgi:CRISPR-associated endonuclease/helicase Cas3
MPTFAEFFRAVNPGKSPFPWQERLVKEVTENRRWPDLLDLPTASGKTSVIDVAVYLMATCPDLVPRRIAFVVDRRVVVQQAAEHSRHLALALRSSRDPDVRGIADRLRRPARPGKNPGLSEPLQWAELRGGIVRDESWALRPDVPAIIVSTVDQVGSRLLHRGYGISNRMWPVHAGLFANDALFFLDEVHLSQPFAETLRAIRDRYRPPGEAKLPDRWQVVELSATPERRQDGDPPFRLSPEDWDDNVLGKRLRAAKTAVKRPVKKSLAKEAAKTAVALADDHPGTVVGVLVNRVNTASQVHAHLGENQALERRLITGRMRPFDRDDILAEIEGRIKTGHERGGTARPLIVVGTQSVEAGADFDFDALVTECAAYDALKQRFGRVDRNGDLSAEGTPSKSVILAVADDVKAGAEDPVYGAALGRTWEWLPEGEFDFASERPDASVLPDLTSAKPKAPILLPSHLDRWVQTYPVPDGDPDVSQWLHGMGEPAQADVNVIWRADLTTELLDLDDGRFAADLVSSCRPGSGEAMSVPLTAVRAWLARSGPEDTEITDIEGRVVHQPDEPASSGNSIRHVLRWLGDNSEIATQRDHIRPGDTIVVPASYGGIEAGNWAPNSTDPVPDLGHRVQAEQRLRAVLRLNEAFIPKPLTPAEVDTDPNAESDKKEIKKWLESLEVTDDLTGRIITHLRTSNDKDLKVTRVPTAKLDFMFVVSSKQPMPRKYNQEPAERTEPGAESDPEASSFTGFPTPLKDHLAGVGAWASFLGVSCGLGDELAGDLGLAGRLHDLGKADRRFQEVLRNGRVLGDDLLAKSGDTELTSVERARRRQIAGYPSGGGHELLSLALIQHEKDLEARASDWDLVLHLVASHHGTCRPFAQIIHDPAAIPVQITFDDIPMGHSSETGMARIDSGVPDRFWRLVRRYGWFGLAWLECLLRLADHRASEAEQEQEHE